IAVGWRGRAGPRRFQHKRKGKIYVIHTCGSSARSVAPRSSEWLRHRRSNSHPAGDCAGLGLGQLPFRAPTLGLSSREPKTVNWSFEMNTKTVIAVILVTLGIVVLAYSGISFTTPGRPVEFLGLRF